MLFLRLDLDMNKRAFSLLIVLLSGKIIFAQTDSTQNNSIDTARQANQIPVFSTNGGDLDAEQESQDMSALLQSSRDVYTATAGFYWGQARYRIRGYSGENQIVMINGVPVNSLETGMASWTS